MGEGTFKNSHRNTNVGSWEQGCGGWGEEPGELQSMGLDKSWTQLND